MDRIPYSCQTIEEEDIAAVAAVLRSPFLTQGPEIARFEQAIADMHDAPHAVAVCNATAALHIACLALDLGPGDRLWTSPISFAASANCGLYCGATVDFVDIDPKTRNMSVDALANKLEAAEEAGTLPKIVVPVDFTGLPCDMAAMRKLADRYGFALIQDASHAVGASLDGKPVGRYADIAIFSFHPVKIVTTGEGGVAVTANAELAQKMALLRSHGITRDPEIMENPSEGGWYYEQILLGFNYRMTDLQAALGLSQLQRLPSMWQKRDERTRRYDDRLADLPLHLPARASDRQSAHHLYVIEIDETRSSLTRRELFDALTSADIGANVHYIPIHLQPHYRRLGFTPGDFPAAEAYYRRAVTIPLFPRMTDEEQDRVIDCLKSALS
ncbi:UDP-4-amino-4,6-dideoxy-N-acetyl-beta-L-altrosamine transaminase [Sphingopyxis sp. C-1]|uniref:UDP-4-amino-4, 6-dideoxy-N-acetyl-beta-L-altrosamine transaminase n=1 Tax=Sphingopyxis sp. C-1 TaxID=262667 RepID=UPI0006BFB5C1|nr:UDP-4-amino-4,6-dideoxy-N-acetyl-beta-L-altrosamine transaminase [Sphingopyxis sp. C-1]GAO78925.1 bacillosamine/Legionaminic acid biosynthesis aminotransferase PglE [Sphingopyxis sp. C-1]